MQQAILGAMILAAAGAFFGAVSARLWWADDLKHAQRLRTIWDRTEAALESRIKTQEEIIATLKRRLGE